MTTQERVQRLEDAFVNIATLLQHQDERLAAVERQAAYTQRIWVAVAKKMGLWDELEEDGLAHA